jgi:multidrug efflux system membrane fusion protein
MKRIYFTSAKLFFVLGILFLVSACQNDSQDTPVPASAGAPPPPAVTTANALEEDVELWKVYTGRLESAEMVELRPRVSGYIDKVVFTEGSYVNKGDLLFKIDDEPFKTEVKRLEAELKSSQAQIALSERDVIRASSLKQTNAISQEQVDNRNTQLIKAKADADGIEAALYNAKLNSGYTNVTAPISGYISRANITQGNYVSQGVSILTTLVSSAEVHAYFDVDEETFMGLGKAEGREGGSQIGAKAELQLAGEDGFPHQGKIDFIDNQINPLTGTIRLRAAFSNKEGALTSGMFARVRMKVGPSVKAVLIDEKAISSDLNSKYVLVVNENNIAEYRAVSLGDRKGNLRIITSGLSANEQIIVKGIQRVFPGMPVNPTKVEMRSINGTSAE